MTKNKVKKSLGNIFRVRSWKLLLVLLPLLFLTATLLRYDHLQMVELRDAVIAADEAGVEEDMTEALNKLKEYTFSHIVVNVIEENGMEKIIFGTGPFYMEKQYTRKAQEELAKAEASMGASDENPNGNVFKKAAAVCDEIGRRSGWNYDKPYFDCIMAELDKYPEMNEIEDYQKAMIPSTSLYRHSYASPVWTFGWSGIAILLCVLIVVVIFIRFSIWAVLRISLIFIKN